MSYSKQFGSKARTSALVLTMMLSFSAFHGNVVAEDKPAAAAQAPQHVLRPEVAKILTDTITLLNDQKAQEALAKVKEAETVPNTTPYESFLILRLRAEAQRGLKDWNGAVQTLNAALETKQGTPAEDANLYATIGHPLLLHIGCG